MVTSVGDPASEERGEVILINGLGALIRPPRDSARVCTASGEIDGEDVICKKAAISAGVTSWSMFYKRIGAGRQ